MLAACADAAPFDGRGSVARDVDEDDHTAVGLVAWLGDELHAGRLHARERRRKVVDAQEQADQAEQERARAEEARRRADEVDPDVAT